MGEVYKARDTRLDRTVAIKVLSDTLAADPQFRERFDREGRAVSQLTHPHICTLYDVGQHEGTAFLVMEYLEGGTLADRLAKGALPVDQALKIAIEIASALDKAHRAGIVHRDLKPGNIMLTRSGAKLLDFGLAKSRGPVVGGAGESMLPTTPAHLTEKGTVLGTFQYMAPEQLEGQEADARTDLFAFGVVLYEMLAGRRAFEGKTHASLIGAILKDHPPPVSSMRPLTPASLDHVVAQVPGEGSGSALALGPRSARRAGVDRDWLDGSQGDRRAVGPQPGGLGGDRRAGSRRALGHELVARHPLARQAACRRPAADAPAGRHARAPASWVLRCRRTGGRSPIRRPSRAARRFWLRPLDSDVARPLDGTDGAFQTAPFWAPDSRSIAYFTFDQLKRIDLDNGLVRYARQRAPAPGRQLECRRDHPVCGRQRGLAQRRAGRWRRPRCRHARRPAAADGASLSPLPARRPALPVLRPRQSRGQRRVRRDARRHRGDAPVRGGLDGGLRRARSSCSSPGKARSGHSAWT